MGTETFSPPVTDLVNPEIGYTTLPKVIEFNIIGNSADGNGLRAPLKVI